MIFGLPGSGKSHFAYKLSLLLKIPVYHLDRYFFIENWVERNPLEFLEIQRHLVAQDNWIIDGNAIKSLDMRYSQATVAMYFHFNRYLCLWRVFKRLFIKEKNIQDRAPGCQECIRWKLLRYMWGFHARISPKLQELKQSYPHIKLYTFYNDQDLKSFIDLKLYSSLTP
jgi:adenylate kinase family enzyme